MAHPEGDDPEWEEPQGWNEDDGMNLRTYWFICLGRLKNKNNF